MSDHGKRLVFLAMAAPKGVAGHHYSMRDLARAFSRRGWQVDVILFSKTGAGVSPALTDFDPKFFKTGFGYGFAIRELQRWTRDKSVNFFIAFDELSNRIATCALFARLEKLLPVKPGWVSTPSWSAASLEFVVFSAEDLLYYRNHLKYRNVHTNLITGRVDVPVTDQAAVEEIRRDYLTKHGAQALALCPVRIERGKLFFLDAVLQSFEIQRRDSDVKLALLIIGAEQDADFRKEIELKAEGLPVSICSDERFTRQLSAVLPAGDIVYAMGRTVMEALLHGRRVFCPSGEKNHPLWEITSDNFYTALSGNFTGRNGSKNLYRAIVPDPRDPPREINAVDMNILAEENMSSDAAIPHYLAAFDRLLAARPPITCQAQAFLYSRFRLFGIFVKTNLGLRLSRRISKAR